MRDKRLSIGISSIGLRGALAICVVAPLMAGTATSQVKILHSFGSGTDGTNPTAGMIWDTAGNLYGTNYNGGIHGDGTVFELTPKEGGGWTEKVLHSFNAGSMDGTFPAAGLVLGSTGNLYGTTYQGGIHNYGTVFELTPNGSGGWTEKVLHSFNNNGSDGFYPQAGLIFDTAGNLYGTTRYGGIHTYGTAFELMPEEGGSWTEKVLHSFGGGLDAADPIASMVFDAAGNLYGTTYAGGIHFSGTVFELVPREGGGWTEKVLHSFGNGTDGAGPYAGVIFDAVGNLYGTTYAGGIHDLGAAFELMPTEGGNWSEKVLHSFGHDTDGSLPESVLVFDTAGNLYGTTYFGGIHNYGAMFELTPQEDGSWSENVLHSFNFNGSDGATPGAGLIFDAAGNLYGTTIDGGIHSEGTVFEFTP